MKFPLFLLLVLAAAGGCRNGATTPTAADGTQEMPADQVMFGVEHNMTTDGIRSAVLHGDTAYVHQGGSRIDVVGVRMVFFDDNGRETGTLTSNTGTYQLRAGSMVAEGNAVLKTKADGTERTIETEQLHFDVKGDRLWSDQAVTMREGGRILRGNSFQSDGRFQNLTVSQAQTAGEPINSRGGGISF